MILSKVDNISGVELCMFCLLMCPLIWYFMWFDYSSKRASWSYKQVSQQEYILQKCVIVGFYSWPPGVDKSHAIYFFISDTIGVVNLYTHIVN